MGLQTRQKLSSLGPIFAFDVPNPTDAYVMTQTAPNNIPLPTSAQASPADILDFWLGDGLALGWPTQDLGTRWFGGGATLDQEIKTRFGAQVVQEIGRAHV